MLLTPGTWTLDPTHSTVGFVVKHLGLANVRGRFNSFDAKLFVGEDLASTRVEATIDLASVDTNNADRDAHLKTTDFFDATKYPTMTFTSSEIRQRGDEFVLVGELNINGIAKPVELDVEFNGTQANPFSGATHAGLSAEGEIKRSDFGVNFQVPLGGDKFLVADKVKIQLDVEFVAPAA